MVKAFESLQQTLLYLKALVSGLTWADHKLCWDGTVSDKTKGCSNLQAAALRLKKPVSALWQDPVKKKKKSASSFPSSCEL